MSSYNPTIPIGQPYGTSGPASLPGSGSNSPLNTGPQSPFGTGGTGSSPFTSSQQSQLQNALSAAGIWDTVQNLGGDVWDTISKILPHTKDAAGNDTGIDWGKLGGDIVGWVKDNKDTILQGLSAYNSYERSQKSDQYAQQALAGAKEAYDAKAPLRLAGQAGMLDPASKAPDISALKAQGQNGLGVKAPTPLPLATGNLSNAQQLANGPGSSNPFTKALPLAGTNPMPSMPPSHPPLGPTNVPPLPVNPTPPNVPQTPNGFTPPPAAPQLPGVPGAPTAPQPLPIYRPPQTGQIRMPGYDGASPRSVSY